MASTRNTSEADGTEPEKRKDQSGGGTGQLSGMANVRWAASLKQKFLFETECSWRHAEDTSNSPPPDATDWDYFKGEKPPTSRTKAMPTPKQCCSGVAAAGKRCSITAFTA